MMMSDADELGKHVTEQLNALSERQVDNSIEQLQKLVADVKSVLLGPDMQQLVGWADAEQQRNLHDLAAKFKAVEALTTEISDAQRSNDIEALEALVSPRGPRH